MAYRRGSRGGEMGEFSPPPLFLNPLLSFVFSYLSNIDWFYYIITKIHPPFQNPGSAPGIGFQFLIATIFVNSTYIELRLSPVATLHT